MSISEQVKELRYKADIFEKSGCAVDGIVKAFREAADAIESLSAKLADMEHKAEDCGDGWIPCKDRLSDKDVLCCNQNGEMIIGRIIKDKISCSGFSAKNDDVYMVECIKWMEKPKP